MSDPTSAALVKLSVGVIERAIPSGFALIKSWVKGKEILVLGPSRAGKTTFIDYLQHGLFDAEKASNKTMQEEYTPRFNVSIGRNKNLEMVVKKVVDIPGQWGPGKHADIAFERNPHAIVLILDAKSPLTGTDPTRSLAAWVQEFSQRLETLWRSNKRKKHRIQTIVVAVNKADKASEAKLAKCAASIGKIINSELKSSKGSMLDEVLVTPTIFVQNPEGTAYLDRTVSHLAKALTK